MPKFTMEDVYKDIEERRARKKLEKRLRPPIEQRDALERLKQLAQRMK